MPLRQDEIGSRNRRILSENQDKKYKETSLHSCELVESEK